MKRDFEKESWSHGAMCDCAHCLARYHKWEAERRGVMVQTNEQEQKDKTLKAIEDDVVKLEKALGILNQVWIGDRRPYADSGLLQAISAIGSEIALLKRKYMEAEKLL